jgi:hypothetical protein
MMMINLAMKVLLLELLVMIALFTMIFVFCRSDNGALELLFLLIIMQF